MIKHYNFTAYKCDVQVDDIDVGGNIFDPEVGTNGFERSSNSGFTDYSLVPWENLTTGSSGASDWLRDNSGTPSGSTGLTSGNTGSYYYYMEGSGSSDVAWLRSPIVTVASDTMSLYTAQAGAGSGNIDVYLEVISS